MSTFLLFTLALCAVFTTISLIIISTEFQKVTASIEDLTSGLDELNMNVRDLIDSKK